MKMLSKMMLVVFIMSAFMACSREQSGDEMADDMKNNSGTTAQGTNSDDLPAGQGDTSLNNGATAGGTNTTNGQQMTQPAMTDANILAKMSMTDTKEINEGKLGGQKAKSSDVKKFAQMLVTHHTQMLNDGKATAQKLAITPAPMPNSEDSAMAVASSQRLSTASAANFDNEFLTVQIEGHQKTLNDLNMMMNATQNADLKTLIQKAIPVVTSHLEQARTIQTKLAGTAGAGTTSTTNTGTTTTTTKKGQ